MKDFIPYKYRLHYYLVIIGAEQGEEMKKEVIGKILIKTQMSLGKFKSYRYAKVVNQEKKYILSPADLTAIIEILNEYMPENEKIKEDSLLTKISEEGGEMKLIKS